MPLGIVKCLCFNQPGHTRNLDCIKGPTTPAPVQRKGTGTPVLKSFVGLKNMKYKRFHLREKKKKRVKENNPLDPVSLALGADPCHALGQGQGQHCSHSLRAPWPRDAQSDSLPSATSSLSPRTRSGAAKSNLVKGEWDQGQSWGTGCQTAQEELWTPM